MCSRWSLECLSISGFKLCATKWKLIISLEGTSRPRKQDCDWTWCSCFAFTIKSYDSSCVLDYNVKKQWKVCKRRCSPLQDVLLCVVQVVLLSSSRVWYWEGLLIGTHHMCTKNAPHPINFTIHWSSPRPWWG
jgi:hypothetical protein